jgi:hypothetical protein
VLLAGLADKFNAQRAVLVVAFAASATLRSLLLVAPNASFFATGALVLVADCLASPVGVIVDSIVVASCANVSATP